MATYFGLLKDTETLKINGNALTNRANAIKNWPWGIFVLESASAKRIVCFCLTVYKVSNGLR